MRVLVVGGAGYIGSVTTAQLLAAGHQVVVYDNLSAGHRQAVAPDARLVVGDTREEVALGDLFSSQAIDAVVYYGGLIAAGESMREPGRYFAHNIGGVVTLLNAMLAHGVRRFVFSSSAAVYGEPEARPITEAAALRPINPYGETKAAVERLLRWYDSQCGLRYVSLRYFNAAGATELLGEDHRPETHLIPIVLQVALGQREYVPLYGSDYPTADGTCICDYIHVVDLARAHLLALERCEEGSAVYNLGNGQGFSNWQVIAAARRVTGHPIAVREEGRRPGDPAVLVAAAAKAERELGWRPQITALEAIVGSAWRWHRSHPRGYNTA
ncbi:MAG: UDP-glucose 4-epimerase GalE [Dehalococcoidia bacterium]